MQLLQVQLDNCLRVRYPVHSWQRLIRHVHCAVSNLEWDSPLDIVRYPDPRLRAQNAKITVFDENLKRLAAEMFDIMYRSDPYVPD